MSNFIAIKDSVINLDRVDYATLESEEDAIHLAVSFSRGGYSRVQFTNIDEARKQLREFLMATLPPMGRGSRGRYE